MKISASTRLWLRRHRRHLLFAVGVVALLEIAMQLVYPSDRLMPLAQIDDRSLDRSKAIAIKQLDDAYAKTSIDLFVGEDAAATYASVRPATLGVEVSNQQRVEQLDYPLYWRLVPTSILWAHTFQEPAKPIYRHDARAIDRYITDTFGKNCKVAPKNASAEYKNDRFHIIKSAPGGECSRAELAKSLSAVEPGITKANKLQIPVTITPPIISDKTAEQYIEALSKRLESGVPLSVKNSVERLPADLVSPWITFSSKKSSLMANVDAGRANEYLKKNIAPKVAVAPGTTKISTRDFTEISRQNGTPGRGLDVGKTALSITKFIRVETERATAATNPIAPRVVYTRSYSSSDTGLSALMKNYASDNKGTFGISMVELEGKKRRAGYNDEKPFITASTYKLFMAYSTLRRVESGQWQWSDQIQGGRDAARCFDDMIVKSDNACAESFLAKIGFRAATDEAQGLGLRQTTFLKGDRPLTSPRDLTTFLGTLASSQMLESSSRSRFIDALKRNIYREGIPAGASGSVVADKVGFLNSLLHDAAIVYSPKGTYVLAIMSDGSTWGNIADLTRKIEELR